MYWQNNDGRKKKVIREKPVLVPHELPWDIYNLDECQSSKCSTLFEGEVHRTVYFMCYIISTGQYTSCATLYPVHVSYAHELIYTITCTGYPGRQSNLPHNLN
jgi:hypothetical protein